MGNEEKVKKIVECLASGTLNTPRKLTRAQEFLSAHYSQLSDEYANLQNKVNLSWLEVRRNTKTDTQADRETQISKDGQRLVYLKYKLKSVEKLISAIKSRIYVANNEVNNNY